MARNGLAESHLWFNAHIWNTKSASGHATNNSEFFPPATQSLDKARKIIKVQLPCIFSVQHTQPMLTLAPDNLLECLTMPPTQWAALLWHQIWPCKPLEVLLQTIHQCQQLIICSNASIDPQSIAAVHGLSMAILHSGRAKVSFLVTAMMPTWANLRPLVFSQHSCSSTTNYSSTCPPPKSSTATKTPDMNEKGLCKTLCCLQMPRHVMHQGKSSPTLMWLSQTLHLPSTEPVWVYFANLGLVR